MRTQKATIKRVVPAAINEAYDLIILGALEVAGLLVLYLYAHDPEKVV